MNKAFAFLLALSFFASSALPAFAEDMDLAPISDTAAIPEAELPVVAVEQPTKEATTTLPIQEASTPAEVLPTETESVASTSQPALDTPAPEAISHGGSEELIVKFKDSKIDLDRSLGIAQAERAAQTEDLTVSQSLPSANILVLSTQGESAEAASDRIDDNPLVEYAEPNYARESNIIPSNDTYNSDLWALENTGQTVDGVAGTADADIDGAEAWSTSLGTSTIVAVIDTGLLYTHPDLASSTWNGSACVDENGGVLGSCIHGYDFVSNDRDPLPNASTTGFEHGTHVAGTIAAQRNNNRGIAGVAPSTKIMALRFGLDVASEVRAIDFARRNGAKIINASFGGTGFSQTEYDAIQRFQNAGGLFVAAAGNDSLNNDSSPSYPAAYDLPGIISVAATDQNDALASFSSYGSSTVDIGAPGVNILSTYITSTSTPAYAYADGTSMSVPHVAGAIALIESLYPGRAATTTKNDIMTSGDDAVTLIGKSVSGKRLNANRALQSAGGADVIAPVITLTGDSAINLTIGDAYAEQGAMATDNRDATTTVTIAGDSVTATSTAGTYHVTYDAVDTSGNHARQVIRTVIVSNPVVVSSGGGGGGGGGSHRSSGGGGGGSSKNKSKGTKSKDKKTSEPKKSTSPAKTASNPARPTLTLATPITPVAPMTTLPPVATGIPNQFSRLLTVGMTGTDVTALQQTLTRLGLYTGPVTGYFGPFTSSAVSTFQVAHALSPVGFVGPMTRALLNTGI